MTQTLKKRSRQAVRGEGGVVEGNFQVCRLDSREDDISTDRARKG